MNSDIISYYKDRAEEYENIYSKPERKEDLLIAAQILQDIFSEKGILEIACGTGYWTKIIAETAHSILATDINDAVIEVAQSKSYSPALVHFVAADLFTMKNIGKFESLFGGFIWSHIKLEDLNTFIDITHSHLENGAMVVFMDNNYVEGSNLPVAATDDLGNTFQIRTLENGTEHKVLKNFPQPNFIRELLADKATHLNFINLQHYWILQYRVN